MSKTIVAMSLAAVTAAPAAAAQSATKPAAAWEPWLGCWALQTEQVGDGASVDPTAVPPPGRGATRPSGVRVCVAPVETPQAVTLTTMVGDTPAFSQTVIADGAPHAFTEAGCTGSQRASWSGSARLLMTSAELTCRDEAPRKVSQVALLTRGGTWLDIQSVTTNGRENIRVRRYRPAAGDADAARETAGTPLTLEDVKDASGAVSPRVIEAALVETRSGFDLDARKLIALDDAGVSDGVIDLIVALSYPDRFTVDRSSSSIGSYSGPLGWAGAADWMLGDPYLWGYYAPYAYSYWGYGYPWQAPGYGWVEVSPGPGPGEPVPPAANGRVVNGLGYTRVREREAVSVPHGGSMDSSSGGAQSAGSSNGSSSGGGSSGVSGQGYSGGGGAGSTGRTAQPRPPGGR